MTHHGPEWQRYDLRRGRNDSINGGNGTTWSTAARERRAHRRQEHDTVDYAERTEALTITLDARPRWRRRRERLVGADFENATAQGQRHIRTADHVSTAWAERPDQLGRWVATRGRGSELTPPTPMTFSNRDQRPEFQRNSRRTGDAGDPRDKRAGRRFLRANDWRNDSARRKKRLHLY